MNVFAIEAYHGVGYALFDKSVFLACFFSY